MRPVEHGIVASAAGVTVVGVLAGLGSVLANVDIAKASCATAKVAVR